MKVPWKNNAAVEKHFISLIRNKQAISPGMNFSNGFSPPRHVSINFFLSEIKTESHPGTRLQVGAFRGQTACGVAEGGG